MLYLPATQLLARQEPLLNLLPAAAKTPLSSSAPRLVHMLRASSRLD